MSDYGSVSTSIGFLLGYYNKLLGNPPKSGTRLCNEMHENLFSFPYPFYLDSMKADFEILFCKHFFEYNIGFETEGAFKMHLQETLSRNYPKYLQLYETTILQYDPLINHKLTGTRKENRTDITDATDKNSITHGLSIQHQKNTTLTEKNKSENNDQSIASDNPQASFAANDYASAMTRGKNKLEGENTHTWSGADTDKHSGTDDSNTTKHSVLDGNNKIDYGEEGFNGSYQEEIAKIRNNIIVLNNIIFADCEDLFLQIW